VNTSTIYQEVELISLDNCLFIPPMTHVCLI